MNIIIVLFLSIWLVCGFILLKYQSHNHKRNRCYNEIINIKWHEVEKAKGEENV